MGAGVANAIGGAGFGAGLGGKVGRALAHGLTRAGIAKAQGGKWSAGFWSGFAGSALGGASAYADSASGKIAISAIVGGTASELGGGKFANGAVSAAFVHMYNLMGHQLKEHELNYKQHKLIQTEDRRLSGMSDEEFTKTFNLSSNTNSGLIDIYQQQIHKTLSPYYVKAMWNTAVNTISEFFSGGKGVYKIIGSIHTVYGSSGKLGYKFTNSFESVSIYEIKK